MRWSLIKTKLICSELQHVYLLHLLLKRRKQRQGKYDKEEKGRVYGWGTGCWKERDTECFRVTWDENTNQSQHICDDIEIHLRHSHDGHCGSRKLNCDGSANGSRRVRDTCDDFAVVLQGVLSHKNFGHVQNFRKQFATSSRLLRGYCEHLRAVHDSFETSSRIESQKSREQSHASEIGA